MNQHSCKNHFLIYDAHIQRNARRVSWVLGVTFLTMVLEIYFGYVSGSMALLADGWHMATHAAALGIAYLTYRLATNERVIRNFNFGGGKIIALGGYTSAIFLLGVVAVIIWSAIERLMNPRPIHYDEALGVAIVGLTVNMICAFILHDHHSHGPDSHDHPVGNHNQQDPQDRTTAFHHQHHSHCDHAHDGPSHHDQGESHSMGTHHHGSQGHDHNIRGAYLHVLADAVTSLAAIVALLAGKIWGFDFLDPVIGIAGSILILKWAYGLMRDTGWELLDGHAQSVNFEKLKSRIEEHADIVDLHVWRIAPTILACELIVLSKRPLGLPHYRKILTQEFHIQHTVIEERTPGQ